ncbi:MAG: hypothetical protein V1834_02430 [Candidatus Micrarchaeota archaeon]
MAKKKGLARRAGEGVGKAALFGVKAVGGALWKGAKWTAGKTVSAVKRARVQAGTKAPVFSRFTEVESFEGELKEFEDFVYNQKSTIGVIIGARGSGKSALGMRILENAAFLKRKTAAIGFKESTLPSWIDPVKATDLSKVGNGSFLLVDEGGISFSSRSSMSSANKLLSELLFISRHKDLSVLFISQNSANLEVNTLRQADYMLLKRPSLMQKDFERKKINEVYEKTGSGFKKHSGKDVFFVYSDEYSGFASAGLPSFWSDKTSKAFQDEALK